MARRVNSEAFRTGLWFAGLTVAVWLAGPLVATADKKANAMIDIKNAKLYDGILVGGQPTPDQFRQAKEAGYTLVVNLRPTTEAGQEFEPALLEELGIRYVVIPTAGAAGMTEENAAILDDVLKGADGRVMVHCASGNRVGGLFALRAHFVQKKSPEDALEEGKKAGLTGLEAAVKKVLGL